MKILTVYIPNLHRQSIYWRPFVIQEEKQRVGFIHESHTTDHSESILLQDDQLLIADYHIDELTVFQHTETNKDVIKNMLRKNTKMEPLYMSLLLERRTKEKITHK